MGMIVANYTPEPIPWTHSGISGEIMPGEVIEMEENRAKYVLNKFDRRGLVQLAYGDDEEVRKAEAMKKYLAFWEYQIIVFNQHNETLKNENKAYVKPPEHIVKHAEDLEIELVGPWTIHKTKSSEEVKELKAENASMKSQLSRLEGMLQRITLNLEQPKPVADVEGLEVVDAEQPGQEGVPDQSDASDQPEDIIDWGTVRNAFAFKSKKQLKTWVKDNEALIITWPEWLRGELETKYRSFYGEALPIEI